MKGRCSILSGGEGVAYYQNERQAGHYQFNPLNPTQTFLPQRLDVCMS